MTPPPTITAPSRVTYMRLKLSGYRHTVDAGHAGALWDKYSDWLADMITTAMDDLTDAERAEPALADGFPFTLFALADEDDEADVFVGPTPDDLWIGIPHIHGTISWDAADFSVVKAYIVGAIAGARSHTQHLATAVT